MKAALKLQCSINLHSKCNVKMLLLIRSGLDYIISVDVICVCVLYIQGGSVSKSCVLIVDDLLAQLIKAFLSFEELVFLEIP